MEKLLDPTLIGVVIGSVLALFGTLISQHFSIKREERQWERERITSKEERQEIAKAAEIRELRDLYQNCLLSLSVYITRCQEHKESNSALTEEIKEIHSWLAMLLLRCPDKKLIKLIDDFLDNRYWFHAEQLRKYVLELVERDEALNYPRRGGGASNPEDEAINNMKTISFHINEPFRRENMVQGIELPQSYSFNYELSDLTNEHRERLLKIYFSTMKKIPDKVQLYIPGINPSGKKVNYQAKKWEAKVSPEHTTACQILELWGQEFDRHLEEAETQLSKNA